MSAEIKEMILFFGDKVSCSKNSRVEESMSIFDKFDEEGFDV